MAPSPSAVAGRASRRTTCGCGKAELGGVLHGDDALAVGEQRAERVEHGGLAGAGASAHDDVGAGVHGPGEELGDAGRAERAEGDAARSEPADRDARPVDGQRGHDHVDPRAVGQAGVGDRRRAVGPQAEGTDDALHEEVDVGRGRASIASRRSSPRRSTQTVPCPFTITSVTASSARSGSRGPSPATRAVTARARAIASAFGSRGWARRTSARTWASVGSALGVGREDRGVDLPDEVVSCGRVATSGGTGQIPCEAPRQPGGEQPGVDRPRDLWVDGDLGDDGGAYGALDVDAAERPPRLAQQHHLGGAQRQGEGAAQGEEAGPRDEERAAGTGGDGEGDAARVGAAVGDDRSPVGGEEASQHVGALRRQRPGAAGKQGEPLGGVHLQPMEGVGGHVGPRRQPARDPRAVGVGEAEGGRRVTGQVDQQRPVGAAAAEEQREGGGDDGGARAALRRPAREEHRFLRRCDRGAPRWGASGEAAEAGSARPLPRSVPAPSSWTVGDTWHPDKGVDRACDTLGG